MAVLLQVMLEPDTSFVLHSRSPYANNGTAAATAVAELAPGLGETLASAQRGSPWRLAVDKSSGAVGAASLAAVPLWMTSLLVVMCRAVACILVAYLGFIVVLCGTCYGFLSAQ